MPVSSGGSGAPGDNARLFAWQMDHYVVRGGPNDPVAQTTPLSPVNSAPPTGGGTLSWNSVLTLPPIPGVSGLSRTMVLNSTTGTVAGGQLTTNNGGILIATIPSGSWIYDAEVYCYTAPAGATTFGLFYTASGSTVGYPVATLNLLCAIATPTAQTLYGLKSGSLITAFGILPAATAPPMGPGNPVTGNVGALASLGDIDVYAVQYGGTATAGCFAAMINFTGLEG